MQKTIILVLTAFLVSIPAVVVAAFAGGDGSPANPYQITNCVQLQEINNHLDEENAYYALNNDIDCSDTVNWNFEEGFGPRGFLPIGLYTCCPFTGNFDGQNHTITGLFINRSSDIDLTIFRFIGLFGFRYGYRGDSNVIKNVGLLNVNIRGNDYVGGLAGHNMSGLITNSYVTGTVTGVPGTNFWGSNVGGLTGGLTGTITNSYSTVDVSGTIFIGGLVGQSNGTIANSYAKGNVNGSGGLVGGLLGYAIPGGGAVTNSYWDTQTSGQSTSAAGTGKTTAEMMQQSTFETWDFVGIWGIKEGVTYPYFKWQIVNAVVDAGPASLWIGLKNSDDQGTQFDLKTELYKNNTLISEGKSLCITGVTRNPSLAKEASVVFGPVSNGEYVSGDTLSLKVFTRIGTTTAGLKCTGPGGSHNNAVGLRLYYDSPTNPSGFSAEIAPDLLPKDLFLHSTGTSYFLNDVSPTGTVKYKDSSGINFNNGNPWKEIGTWSMPLQ